MPEFFCLAVNLLELEDLREVRCQVSQETEINRLTVKEKASRMKKILEIMKNNPRERFA